MPEPSLSELTNIPSEAALGTTGLSTEQLDTRQLNANLFDSMKFKANMDWLKYTKKLEEYKDFVKQGNDALNQDIAPQDREALQQQMAGVLNDIGKDPKSTLGGNGMFGIQQRLSKIQSDAAQSKQDAAYDDFNRKHLVYNPSMATDENKKLVTDFLPSKPLGQREPYILNPPTPEFDASLLNNSILKSQGVKDTYTKSYVSDATGKPGKGYLYDESGTEFNPKAYLAQWDNVLNDSPELKKSVTKRFNDLPQKIKDQYKGSEDPVADFYHQLGVSHANAIVPPGTEQELTDKGNVRFGKTSKIVRDPSDLDWYKARTERYNATKPTGAEKKPPTLIEAPAILLGEHIDRLKKQFNNGKTEVTISYAGTDPKTRLALGLGEDDKSDKIVYRPDGTYSVIDEKGKQKTTGTIDNLVQGFIGAVKTVDIDPDKDKDGTMAQGFQTNSENAFNKIFGTTKGTDIWNTWDSNKKVSTDNNQGADQVKQNKIYSVGGRTFTETQLNKFASKYKMSLDDYKKSIGL